MPLKRARDTLIAGAGPLGVWWFANVMPPNAVPVCRSSCCAYTQQQHLRRTYVMQAVRSRSAPRVTSAMWVTPRHFLR
jgi:hypothetical protein